MWLQIARVQGLSRVGLPDIAHEATAIARRVRMHNQDRQGMDEVSIGGSRAQIPRAFSDGCQSSLAFLRGRFHPADVARFP